MGDMNNHTNLGVMDSIASLDLPEKIFSCLNACDLSTIAELVSLSESDLLGILNIHQISDIPEDYAARNAEIDARLAAIQTIQNELAKHDLSLHRNRNQSPNLRNSIKGIASNRAIRKKLSMRIEEFQFSVRTINCLRSARIERIGDLVQRSEGALLKIPNLGQKTLREINTFLNQMNLSLGMIIGDWPDDAGFNEFHAESDRMENEHDPFGGLHTIEQQLDKTLTTSCTKQSERKIAQLRFGWGHERSYTLEEIGENPSLSGLENSVTRERIRQIHLRVVGRIRQSIAISSQPPALLSAIQLIKQHAPLYANELPSLLRSAGLARSNLNYQWLQQATEITGCNWPFELLEINGQVIVPAENLEEISDVGSLLKQAMAGRSFLRLSEIESNISDITDLQMRFLHKIVSDSPNYRWLDQERGIFWSPTHGANGKENRIIDICKQIFSATKECSIDDLWHAIYRSMKHRMRSSEQARNNTPSKQLLTEMLRQMPYFAVFFDKVVRKSEFSFNQLSSTDIQLFRAAKGMGPIINFADICHNAVKEGLPLSAARLAVSTYNPFFCRVRKGYYRLLANLDEIDFNKLTCLDSAFENQIKDRFSE